MDAPSGLIGAETPVSWLERFGLGGRGSLGLQSQTRMDVLLSSYGAASALVEVEMEVEGGRSVLSDEQSGGAPRAQRRVQDAHCTTKWPHSGRQLGMATRCGTHHTLALCGTQFDPQNIRRQHGLTPQVHLQPTH